LHFSFLYPWVFGLLIFIICFFRCKQEPLKVYFAHLKAYPKSLLTFKNIWAAIVFTLLVAALARPISYEALAIPTKKGRDLVLAIDTSGSMDEEIEGKSKFEWVKEIALAFIQKRFDDNIGIVAFGTFAYTAAPVTYDLNALAFLLRHLQTSLAGNNTAIGDAIAKSVKGLFKSRAKEKVIILLTDGYHNAGSISPHQAVEMAKKEGIKIYTIGIGKNYDKKLLQTIAKESGGKFFEATSPKELKAVFEALNSLAPSPIRSKEYTDKKELFFIPLLLAMAILVVRVAR